jgi:epoxyqueuosine reductase
MKDFISNIEKIVGKPIKTHWYTDTGPMSDRAVAQRSGLGWFGKNTNLLTPTGSWVVLGQIITDIDLESSDQSKKSCGNCTLCIDACPTNAIIGPGILDNNKCISYQTIENKGPIPLNLRKQIGNWIFGCDICQDVCPVNRKSQLGAAYNEFSQPDENRINPELLEILGMSNEDFKKRFAKSPVLRAKINGMKRNVCVALGNIKDPSTVPGLSLALSTEESIVRGHAAWALGEIGGEEALTALTIHRAKEKDNYVIEEINGALERQVEKG